jgi:hypothetical protein
MYLGRYRGLGGRLCMQNRSQTAAKQQIRKKAAAGRQQSNSVSVRSMRRAPLPLRKNVQSWSVVVSGPAPLQQPRAAMLGVPGMGSGGSVPSWKPREIQPRKRPSESAATSTAPAGVPPASTLAACATMSAYVLARPLAPQRISLRAVAVVLR